MKSIIRSLPFLALLIAPSALADKEQSDSCLRTKIWEDYTEGWAVRTATNTQLKVGEHKIYLVTLYAGNTYKFMVCGDESAVDIDLALHDADGKPMEHDSDDDKTDGESPDPSITFTPDKTSTYYVAVYAQSVKGETTNVAMAVTYQ
jgi:hypothetical protein